MIAEVIGLGAVLDYLHSYPSPAIIEHERQLIELALQSLPTDVQLLGPHPGPHKERTSLLTLHVPGVHPLDLATLLDLQGIATRSGHLCAQPLLRHFGVSAALRLSVAPYNTADEIVYFCQALKATISKLR